MAKIAGTLKCQIIKPDGETWDAVGSRMRALRDTLAPALNETMRVLYPAAMAWISAMRDGNKDEVKLRGKWQNVAKKQLLSQWKTEMARKMEFELLRQLEQERKKPGFTRLSQRELNLLEEGIRERCTRSFAPPLDVLSDRELVLARFNGQPLKDLLASRASIPSWKRGAAFYAEGRTCSVDGTPNSARLTYPLWGSGSRATRLAVAPCGSQHRALWRRLVAGEVKMGRVGISYCERKRKWYALISWTGESDIKPVEGQRAACNFGVNVFLQAVAEDGASFRVDGGDILVTRKRFAHRRWSIQKSLDTMGSGSRGHGKRRRLAPLTKLEDAEHRWAQTKCRMVAAELVKWCVRHKVGAVILEDLTGIRDADDESEHVNVRRLIHQWPFYELRLAIERQAAEFGVSVEHRSATYNSQRCPECGTVDSDNVRQVTGREEFIEHHGRAYSRSDKRSVFRCVSCDYKADGDVVAAANLLADSAQSVAKKVKRVSRKKARETTELAAALRA